MDLVSAKFSLVVNSKDLLQTFHKACGFVVIHSHCHLKLDVLGQSDENWNLLNKKCVNKQSNLVVQFSYLLGCGHTVG